MTFFSKKGGRNFREKPTAESAACPGCLCRDRACGQVGRLLLRGPQDWSSTSYGVWAQSAHTASQKKFQLAFSPVFKGTCWSRGKVLTWLHN